MKEICSGLGRRIRDREGFSCKVAFRLKSVAGGCERLRKSEAGRGRENQREGEGEIYCK